MTNAKLPLDSLRKSHLGCFPIFSGAHLEAQDDVPQLNAIPILKIAQVGNRVAVYAGLLGGRFVVEQDEFVAVALNQGMPLLHAHVAEQGDVGALVATEQVIGLEQRIFASFLPTANDLERGRLENALTQRGEGADVGAE